MSASHEQGGGGLMSKLPDEIFLDILQRGSIKTLHRCRFVCKSWYLTIKNPTFTTTYTKNLTHLNNDGNSCFILQKLRTSQLVDRDFQTFTLKLPQLLNGVPTDYSYNGLLLLIARVFANRYPKHFSYYVCNPITGHRIAVPKSPLYGETDDLTIGFGYDPVSQVCKLVRILSFYDRVRGNYEKVTKVEICDLVRGKWRVMVGEQHLTKSLYHSIDPPNASLTGNENKVSLDSIELISSNFRPCVFVNGAIHWLGYRKGSGDVAIISFKLDTEEFYHVLLPFNYNLLRNDLSSSERQPYLFVVRGCLSLVLVQCVDYHECVVIWVMKDYGLESSWEMKYVIRDVVMDNGDLIQGLYMPVGFMENGEILLVCPRTKKMGYYHPVTKKVKFSEFIDMRGCHWRPLHHVCSLISPGSISKLERGGKTTFWEHPNREPVFTGGFS